MTIRKSRISLRVASAAIALALSLSGCANRFMAPTSSPQTIGVEEGMATVVFLRPSSYGGGARFFVVDGEGRYLGDLLGQEYFVKDFPPGSYEFVAWAENAEMLRAELAPGRIYYVLLSVRMGLWTARMSVSKLTPDRVEWAKLAGWMSNSREAVVTDAARAQQWAEKSRDDIQNRIRSGRKALDSMSGEKLQLRNLGPDDGFATPQH